MYITVHGILLNNTYNPNLGMHESNVKWFKRHNSCFILKLGSISFTLTSDLFNLKLVRLRPFCHFSSEFVCSDSFLYVFVRFFMFLSVIVRFQPFYTVLYVFICFCPFSSVLSIFIRTKRIKLCTCHQLTYKNV